MKNNGIKKTLKQFLCSLGYHTQPDFLIAGAQKGGTHALATYLSLHPDVVEPSKKEAHFFDEEKNFKRGLSYYYIHFPIPYKAKERKTFDATPDYMHHPDAPERIKKYFANIKIIFLIRDPVERTFSAWNMFHNHFPTHPWHYKLTDNRSFEEVINHELNNGIDEYDIHGYVGWSLYINQIKRYFKIFPKENILILDSDSLRSDKFVVMEKVCDFLNLKKVSWSELLIEKSSKISDRAVNKGEYKEKLLPEQEQKLRDFFRPYNTELEDFIKTKFSWTNK